MIDLNGSGKYDDLNHIRKWWLVRYRLLVLYMLGPGYISDLEDKYTDDVEEGSTAELIAWGWCSF